MACAVDGRFAHVRAGHQQRRAVAQHDRARVFGRPAKGMMHIEDRLAITVIGSGNRLVARDRVPESLTLRADLNGRQLLMPLPHSLNGGNVAGSGRMPSACTKGSFHTHTFGNRPDSEGQNQPFT